MLKKILKSIRNLIKREVARHKFAREKRENRKRFAHVASVSNAIRREDKPLQVNYHDGRMMGHRGVSPQYYSPIWRELIDNQSSNNRDNDRSKLSTTESGASDSTGVGPCSGD